MAGVKGRSGGHNAKTVSDLKGAGTYRPDRHGEIQNPEPPTGRPEPSPLMRKNTKALKLFNEYCDLKARQGTLTKNDGPAIEEAAFLKIETEEKRADEMRLRKLSKAISKQLVSLEGSDMVEAGAAIMDRIIELERLILQKGPQVRAGRMGMRQQLAENGLTPASRTRVRAVGKQAGKKPSKLLAFMGGKLPPANESETAS